MHNGFHGYIILCIMQVAAASTDKAICIYTDCIKYFLNWRQVGMSCIGNTETQECTEEHREF